MDRRKFLKRVAVAGVSSIAIPIVLKNKLITCTSDRYWWIRLCGFFPPPKLKKDPAFLYKVSKIPEYKVGSRFAIPGDDGEIRRTYEYIMSGQDCNYDPEKYVLGERLLC